MPLCYIYNIYNKNKIKFTAYKLQVIVQNSLINNHLAFAKTSHLSHLLIVH